MTAPVATITGPIVYPGTGRALADRTVTVACVGPEGAVLRTSDGGLVGSSTVHTDADGNFTVDLVTNADIDDASGVGPPGTYWRFTVGTRPAVSWQMRIEAADAGQTIPIGDGARTIVDPTPRGWVPLAGPQGDAGPKGDPGPQGPAGPPARFTRDWARDGLDGLASTTPVTVTKDTATEPPRTLSIVDDSLRIATSAGNVEGSRREVYLLSDTEYTDVEVLARLDAPSKILTSEQTPQVGIALRVHENGDGTRDLINVNNNIVSTYGPVNFGVWSAADNEDGSTSFTQGTRTTTPMQTRTAWTMRHRRFNFGAWVDEFVAADTAGIQVGDTVVIDSVDADFARTSATIVNRDTVRLIVASPSGMTTAVPAAPDAGSISIPEGSYSVAPGLTPRAYFPAWLRARIVGSMLSVRWWLDGSPEPGGWATLDLSAETHLPASGKIGLIVNHCRGAGNYAQFGPVEVTPLATL